MFSLRSGALDRRLCSFSFGKGSFGVLANCSLYGTEATFFFSVGPVCSSFSAEACAVLHALCWSRQHQKVFHFYSLLFSSYLILVLSSPLCPPIFPCTLIPGRNCLLSPHVLSGYNGSPDTRFSQATTQLMSWPEGEGYLRPQQSLVVSLLLSLVFTLLFSPTGGVLFHLNSLTHRFPRFSPRNLCFYAVFSLTFAATDTNLLLSSYLSRIGRIKNPCCSACRQTSHLILHCPATDSLRRSLYGNFLSLYNP